MVYKVAGQYLIPVLLLLCLVITIYYFIMEPYQTGKASQAALEQVYHDWNINMPEQDLPVETTPEDGAEVTSEWNDENLEQYQSGELAFAVLYIPRFGEDYMVPVFQGTTKSVLKKGIGHYQFTAMPGELGNFAVAAHKSLNGGFFYNIDQLEPDDEIIVETEQYLYTYHIYSALEERTAQGIDELYAVPHKPGALPEQALITLQACKNHDIRYLMHGELVSSTAKSTENK